MAKWRITPSVAQGAGTADARARLGEYKVRARRKCPFAEDVHFPKAECIRVAQYITRPHQMDVHNRESTRQMGRAYPKLSTKES